MLQLLAVSLQAAELDAYDLCYVVMCHEMLYHAHGIISVIHINRPRGGSTGRGPHALVHKRMACAGCTLCFENMTGRALDGIDARA